MGRFNRVFLEKLEDVFSSKEEYEYRGSVVIRSPISFRTKNYVFFIRNLNEGQKAEDEKIKIPLKMDITSDMCSRQGFLRSVEDYLETHDLYLAECSVREGTYFQLMPFYVRGELYRKRPTST